MNEQVLNEARKIIAGFLRARRKELNLTQEELAERTGLGLRTVARAEQGKLWLGLKQFLIICKSLHLFPGIAEIESDTDLANVMRNTWKLHPKAMPLEDALKLKERSQKAPKNDN